VRLNPLGTSATVWPIVPAPDDRCWCVWSSRWNKNWQGKRKYSEKTCPSATLSITNPTWPDLCSNPWSATAKSAVCSWCSYKESYTCLFRAPVIRYLPFKYLCWVKFLWIMWIFYVGVLRMWMVDITIAWMNMDKYVPVHGNMVFIWGYASQAMAVKVTFITIKPARTSLQYN
jgi:hypothetical protein